MAERVGDAVAERGAEFSHLGLSPGLEQTLLAPELPAYGSKGIGKGRPRLAIPSIDANSGTGTVVEACREQGHDREQRERAGRGARDRPVRPLALGLDAEMVAHLTE